MPKILTVEDDSVSRAFLRILRAHGSELALGPASGGRPGIRGRLGLSFEQDVVQ